MEVIKLDNHEKIVKALKFLKVTFTTFYSPEILNTFFNKPGFNLYSVSIKNNTFFFIQKDKTKEVRFLFAVPPNDVIDLIKINFNAPYIACNELLVDPGDPNEIVDKEVIIRLEEYVELKDSKIRKQYNRALRENKNLIFKSFDEVSKDDLEIFWQTWAQQKALANEKFKDKTANDRNFLNLYSNNKDYFGVAAYDNNKLIAYSICIPFNKDSCLSGFNKALRGYTNLGLQISYEKAKVAFQKGFKYMNIGSINNDFKKQFLPFSDTQMLYAIEIWRNDTFKTLSPYGYTAGLLR